MTGPVPEIALHPEIAEMVRASRADPPGVDAYTPAELRRRKAARMRMLGPGPEMDEVRDVRVPTSDGEIGARVYVPTGSPVGVLTYYHGGGWVTGTLDDYDTLCRALADASAATVVSVDYRLAPEHPFPAAIDDALAAARWVTRELAETEPLVIAGDSAGGNLAAVCVQELSASGEAEIALQLLVCPVLDHDFKTASYRRYQTGYLLSRADMEWYWRQYLPETDRRDDPRASPLRRPDLIGLPPSLLVLAASDPLRDEGVTYAARLAADGVSVRVRELDDVVHGFFPMATQLERADDAIREIGCAVRDVCRRSGSVGAAPDPVAAARRRANAS
jgi:acetyl esterase